MSLEGSTFCLRTLKLTDTLEDVWGHELLASHGKATKPRKDEFRKRVGTIIERTLTGKARMNAYRDRIAEIERVKERKRARVEQGAVDVPEEPQE